MPLKKSAKKEDIAKNVAEMEESGHPKDQAVAAALDTAREAGADIPEKHSKARKPKTVTKPAVKPRGKKK